MRTNYLYNIESFIGKDLIKLSLEKLNGRNILQESIYYKENYITNPILKIFHKHSFINGQAITFDFRELAFSLDLFRFAFTSHLIRYLESELSENIDYKNELIKSLLLPQGGSYFRSFHELIVGGYLKSLGFKIFLNSSRQVGEPDITVKGPKKFVNEAKLYDDKEFRLVEKINEMSDQVIKFLRKLNNHEVIVFIDEINNEFEKEFNILSEKYLKEYKDQKGDKLSFLRKPEFYVGNEGYLVDYIPSNSAIRFKPNFDMSLSETKLEESITKAEKQFKGRRGIVWITFPHPREFSMERVLLLHVSDIPKRLINDRPQVSIYEFFPQVYADKTELKTRIDVLNKKKEFDFIDQGNFSKFIEDIFRSPVFLVP